MVTWVDGLGAISILKDGLTTVLSLTWESPYLGKMVFILRRGPGGQAGTWVAWQTIFFNHQHVVIWILWPHTNIKCGALWHSPIYDITYSTAATEAGLKSDIKITEDTPYLTDELWGICCEDFWENWLCYKSTTMYLLILKPVVVFFKIVKLSCTKKCTVFP